MSTPPCAQAADTGPINQWSGKRVNGKVVDMGSFGKSATFSRVFKNLI
jgi:hypothetical protein